MQRGPGRNHRAVDRLGVIGALDAAVGPIKQRDRGFGPGELLCGIAAAQLAGEDFLAGLDRQRADRRDSSWHRCRALRPRPRPGAGPADHPGAVAGGGTGLAAVTERMLALLPARAGGGADRRAGHDRPGHHRRGGLRPQEARRRLQPPGAAGRPAARGDLGETEIVLAADLGDGTDDPRVTAPDLLRRALPPCPGSPGLGRVAMRADAGYFAGSWPAPPTPRHQLRDRRQTDRPAVAAAGRDRRERLARRDRHGRRPGRVADYRPDWWPADTRLLIRRVRAGPRPRSPPTPGHGAAAPCTRTSAPCRSPSSPTPARSTPTRFILTNLDVSTPDRPRPRGALVPAPHHAREHLPRQQARRRAAAPPLRLPPGQRRLDVGRAARRHHRRLAAPAHRRHRRRGHPGRARRARRQGHDRHPAPAADRARPG